MRKTFAPLDDVLIERLVQPVVDLFTYRMGQSRAAVTCGCLDLASLAWITSRVGSLSAAVIAWDTGTTAVELLLLLLGLVALSSLRTLFRRAGRKPSNPLR